MKKKVVLFGGFFQYDSYKDKLMLEEIRGRIEIIAVIFLDNGVIKKIDGYPVIKFEELSNVQFDYIINLAEGEILKLAIKLANMLNIPRKYLVAARVFKLPGFDFEKYLRLRNQNISIISDTCWGGYTYHALDLPFQSPFINMFVEENEYIKLICNLLDYLQQPLEFVRYETEIQNQEHVTYPVCRLGDINIYCNHYKSYEEAKEFWACFKLS